MNHQLTTTLLIVKITTIVHAITTTSCLDAFSVRAKIKIVCGVACFTGCWGFIEMSQMDLWWKYHTHHIRSRPASLFHSHNQPCHHKLESDRCRDRSGRRIDLSLNNSICSLENIKIDPRSLQNTENLPQLISSL